MKGIYKYGVIALTVVVVAAVVHQSPVISYLKLNPSGTETVKQTADKEASAKDQAYNEVAIQKYATPDLHLAIPRPTAKLSSVQQQLLVRAIKHSPILFEKNQGQTDKRVKYVSRRPGATLFLTKNEAVLSLSKIEPEKKAKSEPTNTLAIHSSAVIDSSKTPRKAKTAALRLKFVGANPNVRVEGESQKDTVVNYYIGNDPKKWQVGVAAYGKVRYHDLYPGMDLVFYGNGSTLEYDYIVAPGADPSQIRLSVEGAKSLRVDASGDLVMATALGETRLKKPVAFQDRTGPCAVASSFQVEGSDVTFRLGKYNASLPLTIDPELVFGSYLGGSRNESTDELTQLVSDGTGGIWVAGTTGSSNFPVKNAFQSSFGGGDSWGDGFIAHFGAGGKLFSSSFLGGSGDDGLHEAVADGSGGVWVMGCTNSPDLPIMNAFQTNLRGFNSFVAHIRADGALFSSSFLGGSRDEYSITAVTDGSGGVWVVGLTNSSDFPSLNAFQSVFGGGDQDAFVTRVDAQGALVSSSFLGGEGDEGEQISGHPTLCSDASGGIWVGLRTSSSDLTTKNAFQSSYGGGFSDIFIAHVGVQGALLTSSFLGGRNQESDVYFSADGSGGVWVGGRTYSPDLPIKNAFQSNLRGATDAFFAHFGVEGLLLCSSYYGGSSDEVAQALAMGDSDSIWVSGVTSSSDLPTVNSFRDSNAQISDIDAFVVHIGSLGTMLSSSYLGGWGSDRADQLTPDGTGGIWVAGTTESSDFLIRNAFQSTYAGDGDVFIARVGVSGALLSSSYFGGGGNEHPLSLIADASWGVWATGNTKSTNLPTRNAFQSANGGRRDAFVVHISDAKSGLRSFKFVPATISPTSSTVATVETWGNVKAVWIRADAGQNVSTNPIICKRNGNLWTATVSALSLKNRTNNPVTFTATAVTTDSGSPTMWSQLAIVDSGGNIAGIYNDTGQMVKGIVCDNPATFDDLAPTDTDILKRANKLEIRLPSGMVASFDQGSVCLSGTTSTDGRGNPNAGIIVVKDSKVWYLPPDEFNFYQKPSSVVDVLRTPLRNVTVKATIKLTDGRIIAFSPLSITLARPVVVLVHGINSDIHKWEDYIFGVNGTYLDGPAIPYALLDHSSVHKGNGPVEYGAMKLQELSSNAIWRVNAGTFLSEYRKYSGGNQVYSFQYYRNRPLSCKRVDIVAHSYGGVIARWYLASNGSSDSLSWYQRQGTDTSIVTSPANFTQKQNVRKLLTIGSMWRGVPLANYVNEVHFKYEHDGRKFYDAPTFFNQLLPIGDWLILNLPIATDVPSMEVLASDSPWLSFLIYGNANPYQSGLSPNPFLSDVAYGSVAGNDERYYAENGVYHLVDGVQQPSWFSYLPMEYKAWDYGPGYSDGLVPVWSASIPGSFTTVFSNHKQLTGHQDAHNYVVQWLNNSELPLGTSLNGIWQQSTLDVTDPISGGSWRFLSVRMMPQDRSNYYLQLGGIGRLNYDFWGP